jgi:hypothetical protein
MTSTPVARPGKLRLRLAAAGIAALAAASLCLAQAPSASASGLEAETGGEKAATSEALADDAQFLTLLGLVEGHLRVGIELYRQGALEMAKSHMKHPGDELYVDLVPALAARRIEGFAPALEELAAAVEGARPIADADAAFENARGEIDRARAAAGADLAAKLASVVRLVRTAAEEYAVGVKAGRVADPHEYQDAWGFTQAAKQMMAGLSPTERGQMGKAYGQVVAELEALDKAWPSLVPPQSVASDASLLHAAAARIELAGLAAN